MSTSRGCASLSLLARRGSVPRSSACLRSARHRTLRRSRFARNWSCTFGARPAGSRPGRLAARCGGFLDLYDPDSGDSTVSAVEALSLRVTVDELDAGEGHRRFERDVERLAHARARYPFTPCRTCVAVPRERSVKAVAGRVGASVLEAVTRNWPRPSNSSSGVASRLPSRSRPRRWAWGRQRLAVRSCCLSELARAGRSRRSAR